MMLESRTVFIDTQSFVRMGLNVNHPTLQSFFKLCKEGKLTYLITSVVEREVKEKIKLSIKEALSSLRVFRRKARILEGINDENIKSLFNHVYEEEVYKEALSVFEKFLIDSKCKIINSSSVDVEIILDLYFEKKPPFGDGKKKAEFPDAITLHTLLQEIGDNKLYVISGDHDLMNFCESSENLIGVSTLDKFLDIYNKYENAISSLIKKYLKTIDRKIKRKIEDAINDSWAYNEAPWKDSEVDEFRVICVHDIEPTVVWVDDEECLVTFDVDVDIDYTVTGPDFNGAIYDSEDGTVYAFDTTTHSGTMTETFTIEFGLSYEFEDGDLRNVEETEFNIVGLTDGIAIYVEENECDW